MNFYDLSGDRDYQEVRNEFYKESQVMLLMYDVSRKGTFEALPKWLAEAEANAGEHLQIFVIACKTDIDKKRAISKKDGETFTQGKNLCGYYESSAKEGKGYIALMSAIA